MAQFSYAKKDGSLGTVDAASPEVALKSLPADAASDSGVQAVSTPTGLPGLPSGGGATTPPALPDGKPSALLSFAQSLDAAVNLARQSRSTGQADIMAPYRGTASAGDFASILGNMNAASDKTSSDLIKTATGSGKLLSVSDAKELGVPYGTTEDQAARLGIVPKNVTTNTLVKTGALNYTKEDYSDDASQLETSRGSDGWVNSGVYKQLYDAWVAHGGKIADFVKTFPPADYVNPQDESLPIWLRPKKSGPAMPSFLAK